MERVARDYFYYLEESAAEIDVVLGDARITLERDLSNQGSRQFDILVLDAFSGDAIPVHLLTREAFALYWEHLAPSGTLVVHISNIYLDLQPIVRGLTDLFEKKAVLVQSEGDDLAGHDSASWVIITNDEDVLGQVAPYAATWSDRSNRPIVWTDDYSNLLSAID